MDYHIGDRQKGRLQSGNIINVPFNRKMYRQLIISKEKFTEE